MSKKFTVLFLGLMLLLNFGRATYANAATPSFSTATCASLVCNPAQNLFSTAFCGPSGVNCSVEEILGSIIRLLLGLAGLVALAYIILGGYQIATARGNTQQADSGRKTLTNAIIGLVIIILSYVIVTIVVNAAFGNVR